MKIKEFLNVESKGNVSYEVIDSHLPYLERKAKKYDFKEEILKDKNLSEREIDCFFYYSIIESCNAVIQIII